MKRTGRPRFSFVVDSPSGRVRVCLCSPGTLGGSGCVYALTWYRRVSGLQQSQQSLDSTVHKVLETVHHITSNNEPAETTTVNLNTGAITAKTPLKKIRHP